MSAEQTLNNKSSDPSLPTTPPAETPAEEQARPVSIGERLRSPQTIISFVIAFALIFFIFKRLNINFSDVWIKLRDADPLLLLLGFAAYYGSFPFRAMRWRLLLENASISRKEGHNVPNIQGLTEIYVLAWFANCVVPAKLGDAYRGYLLKKHAGPSFSKTLGTIFAERLLDIVALVIMMVLSGLFVFHGTIPHQLRGWFIAGGAIALCGILGLVVLMTASHRLQVIVPKRFREHYLTLAEGIITSFSRQGIVAVSFLTLLVWSLEGVRVYFVASSLGVDLSISAAIFVALLASLLTTVPFTPAGLGFVEGGTVAALQLFKIAPVSATAVALLDRTVASYSVIVIGGLLYLVTKRK